MAKNKPIPTPEVTSDGAVTKVVDDKPLLVYFTSDVHFDSPFCYRDRFYEDLEYAKKLGALIWITGDFFDAMQGRFDPRRDMDYLRPEYRRNDYYDIIVDDAVRLMRPWRRNILGISFGNHEGAVLKNANTDILSRFIKELSIPTHQIVRGGYGGIISFDINGYEYPSKYFHGAGGEAPVTKGVIQTARQAAALDGFVLVLNGHNHNQYHVPISRETFIDGEHKFITQHHVRTPGYAMTFADGTSGWEATRGGVPKPIGGYFIEFGIGEDLVVTSRTTSPTPIKPVMDIYDGPEYPQE